MISKRRLDALLNRRVPTLTRQFREAFERMSLDMPVEAVESAVSRFDVQSIMAGITFDNVATRRALRGVEAFFIEIGTETSKAQRITRQRPKFDPYSRSAIEYVNRWRADIMQDLRSEQQNSLNRIIGDGYLKGRSFEQIALDLVGREDSNGDRVDGAIGLDTRSEIYVENVTDKLTRKGDALLALNTSMLFTAAEKATIAQIAGQDRYMTQDERDGLRRAYRSRMLRSRGRRIARTELHMAREAGQRESVDQLVGLGLIGANQIVKRWNTRRDARVREDHVYMEGESVGLNEDFNVAGYLAPYPGFHGLPGRQRINCRCSLSYGRRDE